MNRKSQITRVKASQKAIADWLRADIPKALSGPRRKEVLQLLKTCLEADRRDPSMYHISIFNFSSTRYYELTLLQVKDMLDSLHRHDISVVSEDTVRQIRIAFNSSEGLAAFAELCPFYSGSRKDRYEFIEHRRNPRTRRWKLVEDPVMWGKS